ncbi:MAG: hypothetical protein FWG83_05335 [Oscillospiraceae bacterium]|nr:hypothetical protein [Oscillospiraceae bacterium]
MLKTFETLEAMKTVLIDKENVGAFFRYVPKELREELEKPDMFAIGAVNPDNTSAGIIVVQVVDNWLEILWLYIGEQFRNNGGGRALLDRLFSCFEYAPELVGIFGNFPADNTELKSLYEAAGFEFEDGGIPAYTLTVSDLQSNPFWQKTPPLVENVVILKELSDVSLRKFEVKLSFAEWGVALESPVDWKKYDPDLSVAYIKDKEIEGILLVEKEDREKYAIALSFVFSGGVTSAFAAMLYKAGKTAIDSLNPEMSVDIAAITEASSKLVKKLIGNVKTYLSKCAVYRNNSEGELQ